MTQTSPPEGRRSSLRSKLRAGHAARDVAEVGRAANVTTGVAGSYDPRKPPGACKSEESPNVARRHEARRQGGSRASDFRCWLGVAKAVTSRATAQHFLPAPPDAAEPGRKEKRWRSLRVALSGLRYQGLAPPPLLSQLCPNLVHPTLCEADFHAGGYSWWLRSRDVHENGIAFFPTLRHGRQ